MYKLTIITAALNSELTIADTIKSIQKQKTKDIQYIIIDGGSSDNTINIINGFIEVVDVIISERDCGIYDAWNKGIELADGEFIAFLGSDDTLCENYTNDYLKAIENYSDAKFISSQMIIKIDNKKITYGKPFEWEEFTKTMEVVHPGALHHNTLFKIHGKFDTAYKIAGDYEFLLRCGNNLKSAYFAKPTVVYSLEGVSSKNKLSLAREVLKAKNKNKINFILLRYKEYYLRVMRTYIKKIINIKI